MWVRTFASFFHSVENRVFILLFSSHLPKSLFSLTPAHSHWLRVTIRIQKIADTESNRRTEKQIESEREREKKKTKALEYETLDRLEILVNNKRIRNRMKHNMVINQVYSYFHPECCFYSNASRCRWKEEMNTDLGFACLISRIVHFGWVLRIHPITPSHNHTITQTKLFVFNLANAWYVI